MRMDRRAGLLGLPPTLESVLSGISVLAMTSVYEMRGSATVSLSVSGIDKSTPYYLIIGEGVAMTIAKVSNTSTVQVLNYDNMAETLTANNSTVTGNIQSYGYTAMAVRFNGFSDAAVDEVLSGATITRKAGRNSRNASAVYIGQSSVTASSIYMSQVMQVINNVANGAVSFSHGSSITTPLSAYLWNGSSASSSESAFLVPSSSSYFASIETNSFYVNVAGIWEFTE